MRHAPDIFLAMSEAIDDYMYVGSGTYDIKQRANPGKTTINSVARKSRFDIQLNSIVVQLINQLCIFHTAALMWFIFAVEQNYSALEWILQGNKYGNKWFSLDNER